MTAKRLLLTVGMIVALATPAAAKSPVRFTPDGTGILVNKTVNGERWAITLDVERATITGNVFVAARGETFLWCGIVDSIGDEHDLAKQTLVLHCFAADPCADLATCHAGFEQWHSMGEVRIAGSFFLP